MCIAMPGTKEDLVNSENRESKQMKSPSGKLSTLQIEGGSDNLDTNFVKPKISRVSKNMKGNKLEIEPGENEDYAYPSSATSIGSRPPPLKNSAHGYASASSRKNFRETWSSIAPSLKVLSPDEVRDLQEMQDLEIKDFGSDSGSDLTDDSDDDEEVDEEEIAQYLDTLHLPGAAGHNQLSRNASSLFQVVEPGKLDKESTVASSEAGWEQESLVNTARQLSLLENEADSEVDSEEENEIMKEIKNEIKNQVKNEMRDELAVMKRQIQADSGANKPVGDDDLENLEPDLKAALLKVRKLDRILAKKIKREKEVKRERILLQRRLKKELEEIKPEGRDEVKEAQVNTSKFLALTLPPRHNAGIKITEEGEIEEEPSPPVTPVFTTQVPDEQYDRSKHPAAPGEKEESRSSSRATDVTDATSHTTGTSHTAGSSLSGSQSTGSRKKGKKKKKNFIKRNMELAGDAANPIAMTEDEKQRLGGLLSDLDQIPESFVDDDSTSAAGTDNPYQITLSTSEGFHPAQDEQRHLEAIDKRLQALLPKSDFDSISSTPVPRAQTQQPVLFTRSRPPGGYDIDQLGERALRETKEERDLYQRLKDIEYELDHITDRYQPEPEPPTLSKETLDQLLDDCVRSMSTVEPETPEPQDSTCRSVMSVESRVSLLSNAPRLAPDVLQELIADARRSICGSSASNQLENGHDEGDMELESASQTPTNPPSVDSRPASRTPQNSARNQPTDSLNLQNGNTQNRNQLPDSLNSQNNNTHGQETVLNGSNSRPTTADSWSSSRPSSSSSYIERKPFLPEIDPKGRMSTQRQGSMLEMSESFAKSGKPMLAKTVWSSFSDADVSSQLESSRDSEIRSNSTAPIPHPPTSGRKSKNKNKHRTASPSVKVASD